MPPSAPFGGVPRVGLVFARLMVEGENRGIRPFIVVLGDGKSMSKGITSRYAPLQYFNIITKLTFHIQSDAKARWCQTR